MLFIWPDFGLAGDNVEVTGAARLYRAASVWTEGLCLAAWGGAIGKV